MGDCGRKFVEETFNWELITKNFIKIAKSYLEVKKNKTVKDHQNF